MTFHWSALTAIPTPLALPITIVLFLLFLTIRPTWPTHNRATSWIIWFTWTVTLAYTLTPSPFPTNSACTPGINAYNPFTLTEPALNIWLFLPAGATIWLLPTTKTRITAFLCLLTLPLLIESIQHFAGTTLNRACQYGDLHNNITGIMYGAIIGGTLWKLRHRHPAS